jgi:hypothetical protein
MAASGVTNRDVATALFVSPKAFEANLARIYRKLDIKTRTELGRLHRRPLEGSSCACAVANMQVIKSLRQQRSADRITPRGPSIGLHLGTPTEFVDAHDD